MEMAPAHPSRCLFLSSAFSLLLLSFGLFGALHVVQAWEVDTEDHGIDDYQFSVIHKDHKSSTFRTNWNSNFDRLKHYAKSDRRRLSHLSFQMRKFASVSKKETATTVGIPLSNGLAEYGVYYITLYISNKNLKQYLVYDTGGDLVWVQCQECGDQCFSQINEPYSLISSPTSKNLSCSECKSINLGNRCLQNVNCVFNYAYGVQTLISGTLAKENFYLKLFKKTQYVEAKGIIFGCATQSTNFGVNPNSPNVDGIAGFGISPFSFSAQVAQRLNQTNAFSSCLVSNSLLDDNQLVIGSKALAYSNVSYTPILTRPKNFKPYFYVQVLNVSINNKVLKIPQKAWNFGLTRPNGGTFLDSGTANIFLTNATFQPIVNSVKNLLKGVLEPVKLIDFSVFSLCYYLVIQDVSDFNAYFPPITFTLKNNVNVTLLGSQYMSQVSTWVVCSAFQVNTDDFNVLGAAFQQDQLIVHNVKDSKLGFKPMDCAKGKPR